MIRLGPLALGFCLSSCTSFTTMQTARVMDVGKVRGYFAPSVYSQRLPASFSDIQRYAIPVMEFGARYGLTERVDVGAKIWTYGAALDAKFQLRRDTTQMGIDLAIAPGLAYSGQAGGDTVDYVLPLLIGLNMTGGHSFIIGPKISGKVTSPLSTLIAGTSLGMAIRTSKKVTVLPELNVLYPFGTTLQDPSSGAFRGNLIILQLGVGFLFDR